MPMPDLTTIEAVKSYGGIDVTTSDQLLQSMIAAYSAAARAYCNRDFTAQDYAIVRDGQGTNAMPLPQFPVTSVSSVTVDGRPIQAQTAFGTPGFRFSDRVVILDGFRFTRGFGNVSIAFTAGYEDVPADIAQAVSEWVMVAYKERDRIGHASKSLGGQETVSFITSAMPDRVKSILDQHASIL